MLIEYYNFLNKNYQHFLFLFLNIFMLLATIVMYEH